MGKMIGVLLCVMLMILQLELTAAEVVVAQWDFNSHPGNIISDISGNNHNAVISANSQAETFVGPDGNAIFFNGGYTSVQTPHAADLSFADDFTIKCIIKPTMISDYNSILFKGDRKSTPDIINYDFEIWNGKICLKTKTSDDAWHAWASSAAVVNPNQWYWVVISYKNNFVKLWVNGKSCTVIQTTVPGGKFITNNCPLRIGEAQEANGSTAYSFVGLIDDIKIIKGTLTSLPASEVTEWNTRFAALAAREVVEKTQILTAKIDEYGAKYSVSPAEIADIKNKLSLVALMPVDKTAAGFAAVDTELNALLFKSYFKKYCSNPDGFVIAPLDTSRRVEKRPDFVTMLPPGSDSFCLQSAGNETEGIQALMIANPDKDVNVSEIKVSSLIHSSGNYVINSSQITFGRIKDIDTTLSPPDVPVDFVGAIPDLIEDEVPPAIIPKASFVPVYFRVSVPSGTPAGIYKGNVSFSGGGFNKTVEFQLRVFDFSLPRRLALKMAFTFSETTYAAWYGYMALSNTQKMYLYNFLLNYGISPNNIYNINGAYPDLTSLSALKDRINILTFCAGGPDAPVSDSVLQSTWINPKVAVYNQIKALGLEQYAYFYSYDELSANATYIPGAQQMLPAIRGKIPGLKALQTSFPIPEIKDLFNCWSPIFYYFEDSANLAALDEVRARGDQVWWYSADAPVKPYPNYFLDYPVFDCRIIATLSFMYKVDGVLYWAINREWDTNTVNKTGPWKPYIINIFTGLKIDKNGMGNLIYPGPAGRIYPSLRLENLRDGVEDYEYLSMLKTAIANLQKVKTRDYSALLAEASALLTVPPEVAVAVNYYSSNPDNLLNYRKKVAEMIEEINAENPETYVLPPMVKMPPVNSGSDLIVNKVWWDTPPVAGQPLTVKFKISNIGTARTNAGAGMQQAKVFLNNVKAVTVRYDDIDPKASVTLTATVDGSFITNGKLTKAMVWADATGQVTEIRETNNTGSASFLIDNRPDLVVKEITLSPKPAARKALTIFFKISNIGAGTAATVSGAQIASIYVDGKPVGTIGCDDLAKGAFTAKQLTLPGGIATAGTHKIKVIADSAGKVNEINEFNNSLEKSFIIAK